MNDRTYEIYVYEVTDAKGKVETVVCEQGCDTVFLSCLTDKNGEPQTFESDAHHLYSWAEHYGFKIVCHTIHLNLENRVISNWTTHTQEAKEKS